MQLPEKMTVDWVDNERLIEKYNQLIDYLAEKEKESHTPDRPLNQERE